MDQLPVEIIVKILKLLPCHQLFRCKRVNKKLNTIINSFQSSFCFDKLILTETYHLNGRWFSSYEQLDWFDLIKIKKFQLFFLHFDEIKFHFINIRYLYLTSTLTNSLNFSLTQLVNQMKQLEHLEVSPFR